MGILLCFDFCAANPVLRWGGADTESDTVMPELRVDEPVTRELLDALYPHLIVDGTERTRSTVFLDACLNGKPVADKNMLLFVAHQLAGAEVFASKISFDNSQFVLDNYLHFNAHIMSQKQDKMVSAMFHPGLRALYYHPNRVCKKKELVMAQTMELCAELCQKAGDACKAFTYFPEGNKRVTQVCFHSKRCSSFMVVHREKISCQPSFVRKKLPEARPRMRKHEKIEKGSYGLHQGD